MNRVVPLVVLVALTASACFSADARELADPKVISPDAASPDALHVSLTDYNFDLPASQAAAGTMDFVVTNDGKGDHEFVIVPLDGGRFGLPLGEIEAFGPSETRAMRAELQPGKYEFVCLIVSVVDDEPQSHMALGMRIPFEVRP